MEPTACSETEAYALRVTDDSMEPEFQSGAIIIIDSTGRVTDGAFVIAEVDGSLIFRQYRRSDEGEFLVALNATYPAIPLEHGVGAIRGIVVQRAGRRRRHHKRYD